MTAFESGPTRPAGARPADSDRPSDASAPADTARPSDTGLARDAATSAFDDERPPSLDLIEDCVHCGFCLPTCPTYVLWGEEMDSPRGRIHLMKQGLEGAPMSDAMVGHFDACLGCMACVTACPSGVQYQRLIEDTRGQVERRYPRSAGERALRKAIFSLFPYPRRLRALRGPLTLYQRTGLPRLLRRTGLLDRLAPSLAAMERLAPPLRRTPPLPTVIPAVGERRAVVGLLTGCVQSAFFPQVTAATARVLAAEGCEVLAPAGQSCCGSLSEHVGRADEARRFARRTIDTFTEAGVDFLVTDAAGCGSVLKEYGELLADDDRYAARAAALAAKVRDVTELLVELGPVATRHPLPARVAYHDACHLAHMQRVRSQPRALLRGIPDLELVEIAEPDICCGSAGVYNLLQPEPARELGERKAANVAATGAELLVAGNPGCLLQIAACTPEPRAGRRGRTPSKPDATSRRRGENPIPLAHTVEVLDASLRGLPVSALLAPGRRPRVPG